MHFMLMTIVFTLSIATWRWYDVDKKAAKAAGTFDKEEQKKKIWRILIPLFAVIIVILMVLGSMLMGNRQVAPMPMPMPAPQAAPQSINVDPKTIASLLPLLQAQKGGGKGFKNIIKQLKKMFK